MAEAEIDAMAEGAVGVLAGVFCTHLLLFSSSSSSLSSELLSSSSRPGEPWCELWMEGDDP